MFYRSLGSNLGRREIENIDSRAFFSGMQERCGASRKNNLPAYLSQHTAAAWLSSVELDRNDMADYTDTTRRWCCSALLALKRPQVPRVGPPRPRLPLDGTLLCRRRAHLFALQPHVRRRPAERTDHRLCAGLAHAAREHALPLSFHLFWAERAHDIFLVAEAESIATAYPLLWPTICVRCSHLLV